MRALKSGVFLAFSVLLCLLEVSCGGGKPPTPVGSLVIGSAALPTAVINVAYSATLTATGGQQPFTWSIASGTLPAGLNISSAGVISGTPTTLGTSHFKVQVTDSQTPTAAVDLTSKSIIVNSPLAITTSSLTAGSVNVPYSGSVVASGGVPAYTWSITSGSLPAGLTLSTAGLISGTPTSQGASTFTVQVSDSQTPSATATASLSLAIGGPASRLNGNYVFSLSGFSQGNLVVQAASFTADGMGNITNGLMDSNSAAGPLTKLPFTGIYSLDTTNTGPMTLNIPGLGTFTYQLAVPAVGTIRFIQNGTAGNQGSGVIRKVASTVPVTVASLAAYWAFGAIGGDVSNNRYAATGTFQASSTGAWTNGVQDINNNGIIAASQSFTGSFVAIDPVTGRGIATLNANSAVTNYSFFPVSSSELIMLGIDPVSGNAPLVLFTLDTRPLNNYTNATLNATTVAALEGVATSSGSSVPYGLLALVKFDGAGNFSVSIDENLGGTLSPPNHHTGTYSVETNGRTTLAGFGSSTIIFYLSASIAFTVGADAAVTAGTIVPQVGTSLSNSSISGPYQGGTVQAVLPTVTVEANSATADGAGNLALFYDTSGPGGPQQGLTSTATYSVDSTGRAPLTANGSTTGIAYVVSDASSAGGGGKILVLSTDANPKINSLEK